jgi:hypothetical protein
MKSNNPIWSSEVIHDGRGEQSERLAAARCEELRRRAKFRGPFRMVLSVVFTIRVSDSVNSKNEFFYIGVAGSSLTQEFNQTSYEFTA